MSLHWEMTNWPLKHGRTSIMELEESNDTYVEWSWLNQDEYKSFRSGIHQAIYSHGKIYLRPPMHGDISMRLILRASAYRSSYEYILDLPHEDCRRCAFQGFLKATRIVL